MAGMEFQIILPLHQPMQAQNVSLLSRIAIDVPCELQRKSRLTEKAGDLSETGDQSSISRPALRIQSLAFAGTEQSASSQAIY